MTAEVVLDADVVQPSAKVAEGTSGSATACVRTLPHAFSGAGDPEDALHFEVGDLVQLASPDHATIRCTGTVVARSAVSLTIAVEAGTVEAVAGDVIYRLARGHR